ncbi:MAG: ribonuclease J [Hyphomicrobiaceae bacterium]|nr:ribonuclease J [Hyphomicrobiaceae bacterium]
MAETEKTARASRTGGSELVLCALGGLGEIGMNCYLYGSGPKNAREWMMVDIGITFPEGEFEPGVDVILPDLRFIEDEHVNLKGIVLTHAHEDHFGALIELWPRLKVPVYATPFTAALIRAKLAEQGNKVRIPIREIPVQGKFEVGPFNLEFISMAHSIPEPQALVIRTADGTVLHTGDWKIDATPYGTGTDTDAARISALGIEGVSALICDSTNALREGRSPSESDVAASLIEVIGKCSGAVGVTIFSSNVARIQAIWEAARAQGRVLVVAGRAMHRMISVAMETGHLPPDFKYVDQNQFSQLSPSKALVLCTGSQGESRAAVARIAAGEHPQIKFGQGDTLIFSSRTIPGNERPVGRIQNRLVERGVKLITDTDALVHVTGHPRRDELKEMYAWVKPQLAIPMHGEARHLAAHAELARKAGVPKVMIVRNGDIVRLAPGEGKVIDEAPVGRMYRDGDLLVDSSSGPVRDRRKLSEVGICVVSLVLDEKGGIAAEPDAILDGIPETDAEGTEMYDIVTDAIDNTLKSMPPKRRADQERVEEAVRRSVRGAIENAWGKRPIVKVMTAIVDA